MLGFDLNPRLSIRGQILPRIKKHIYRSTTYRMYWIWKYGCESMDLKVWMYDGS